MSKHFFNCILMFSLVAVGLLLSLPGVLYLAESEFMHRILVESAPVGRIGSLLAVFLILVISLTKSPVNKSSEDHLINNFYFILFLLFLCVWVSLLPALGSWANVDSIARPVGGLIPLSDSKAYYEGAEQLIQTGEFGSWNQRRPLNVSLLSARLLLGFHNFQYAILLQSVIFGVAIFFLTFIIWRAYGALSASLVFLLNFAFAAHYLPTTLSESLGISLGLLSLAFFLLSFQLRKDSLYHLGVFVITLALLARAGTVFVIPLMILYAGKLFSINGKYNYKQLLIASGAAIFAIIISYLLNVLYGDGAPGVQGNSHYIIYKLAVGGDSWKQIYVDFPEIRGVAQGELASFSLSKALEAFLNKPEVIVIEYFRLLFTDSLGFLKGLFHSYMYSSYSLHVSEGIQRISNVSAEYAEVIKNSLIIGIAISILLLIAFGLFRVILYLRHTELFHFIIIALLGTFISLPFLFNIAGVRVFAVIIPFLTLLPMMAALAVRRHNVLQDNGLYSSLPRIGVLQQSMTIFLGLIIVLALTGPYFSHEVYAQDLKMNEYNDYQCPSESRKFVMRFGPGAAYINIVADTSTSRSFVPTIRKSDYVLSPMHRLRRHWESLPPGTTLLAGYDYLTKKVNYITFETVHLGNEDIIRVFCAHLIESEGRDLWELENIKALSSQ